LGSKRLWRGRGTGISSEEGGLAVTLGRTEGAGISVREPSETSREALPPPARTVHGRGVFAPGLGSATRSLFPRCRDQTSV